MEAKKMNFQVLDMQKLLSVDDALERYEQRRTKEGPWTNNIYNYYRCTSRDGSDAINGELRIRNDRKEGSHDPSRRHLNFRVHNGEIKEVDDLPEKPISKRWWDVINEKYRGTQIVKKRLNGVLQQVAVPQPIRKDQIRLVNFIIGGSRDEMLKMSFDRVFNPIETPFDNGWDLQRNEKVEEYALEVYRFFERKFGKGNVIGFECHLDQTNPHFHVSVVPLTPEGKLSVTELFGAGRNKTYKGKQGRDAYSQFLTDLHTEFYEQASSRFGLRRGNKYNPEANKHKSAREFAAEKNRLNSEIKTIQDELQKKQSAIKGLTTMLNNLNARKMNIDQAIEEAQQSNNPNLAELLIKQKNIESSIKEKEEKLKNAESDLRLLNSQISEKGQLAKAADAEYAKKVKAIKGLTTMLNNLNAKKMNIDQAIEEAQQSNNPNLAELLIKQKNIESSIKEKEEKLREAESELINKRDTSKSLDSQIAEKNSNLNQITEQINQNQIVLEHIKSSVIKSESNLFLTSKRFLYIEAVRYAFQIPTSNPRLLEDLEQLVCELKQKRLNELAQLEILFIEMVMRVLELVFGKISKALLAEFCSPITARYGICDEDKQRSLIDREHYKLLSSDYSEYCDSVANEFILRDNGMSFIEARGDSWIYDSNYRTMDRVIEIASKGMVNSFAEYLFLSADSDRKGQDMVKEFFGMAAKLPRHIMPERSLIEAQEHMNQTTSNVEKGWWNRKH